jgi:pyridoxine 5'-phosphate synthase PdxJ
VHAIAAIPQIVELNISHAIVATRYCRFRGAVREMKALMHQARKP